MKYLTSLLLVMFLSASVHAQITEGDALINIVGGKVNDPATQKLFADYSIKKTQEGDYASDKYGINVNTSNDSLTTMTIYKNSEMYGSYTGRLPKGIRFGMSHEEIVKLLGKPSLTYINTGYSEYTYGPRIMACWFDNKMLNQVLITLK